MEFLNKYYCPACGYNLDFAPWIDQSPSDEICPCCGIQYGHDDLAGGDLKKRQLKYEVWKIRWMNEGMPWKSQGIKKTTHWNPLQQLKNLEKKAK